MATGIEVAGIALAVFPIVVGALRRAVDGTETIKYWRWYRGNLIDYASFLETARAYFFDTVDELLTGIVHSQEELTMMMNDPGGPAWKRPEYEERLRERLDHSYETYIQTLRRIPEALAIMRERLGIDDSGKILWEDYTTIVRELKRLKLTFFKTTYEKLLADIDKANKDLRDFTHQNRYLEPIRKKRRLKRPISDLKSTRAHARSLNNIFITGAGWKCRCQTYHVLSLRLDIEQSGAGGLRRDMFRILLSNEDERGSIYPKLGWLELKVKPSGEQRSSIENSQSQQPEQSSKARSIGKKVSFAVVEPAETTKASIDPVPEESVDLCDFLTLSRDLSLGGDNSLGYLIDDRHEQRPKHHLYRVERTMRAKVCSKSLKQLLQASGSYGTRLSRKDRLQIAATLASSVLQLDGTSWLRAQWTSDDILFHNAEEEKVGKAHKYPYLAWRQCLAPTVTSQSVPKLRAGKRVIHSEIIFALGLALVELCFGRTLSELQTLEDIDLHETAVTANTAMRLCNNTYDEMGDQYGDVVRRCLYQPFDVREMSLDNEQLQQKVLDDIIMPLIRSLQSFSGDINVLETSSR